MPALLLFSPSLPVTNLEGVVLQLQESNGSLKSENTDLRNQNVQLRNEARDREKFWRALWQARSTGMPPDPSDEASLPSYAQLHHSSPMPTPSRLASVSPTTVGHYQDPRMHYAVDPSSLASQAYPNATTNEYMQRSPALGFAPSAAAVAGPSRPQSVDPQRMPAYYTQYATDGSSPDDTWQQHGLPTPVTDRGHIDGSPSPTYVESPSLTTSELAYPSHCGPNDDPKMPMNAVNQSPYMYTASRSTSPASTPTSTSSLSLAAAPYQFTFPEGTNVQDRPEFAQRRPNPYFNPRGPELTLHGGTADIPIGATMGDALRYRMTARANTLPAAPQLPYGRVDQTPQDAGSDEDEAQAGARSRPRRSTAPGGSGPSRSSHSPSPPPPISGTLAVIKAQAFGALRRTRGRSRRSSDGAAKLSVEALSARGISLSGPAAKRQKLRNGSSHDTLT